MEQIKNIHWDQESRAMILWKIECYLKAHAMPETKFGRLAVKDPRLVRDLRAGREPGPRMVARIDSFIAQESAR